MPNTIGSVCLLIVLLAGCATDRHQNTAQAPIWETPDQAVSPETPVSPVTPVPPVAPPAPAPLPPPPTTTAPTNLFTETWISLDRWCQANGLAAPSQVTAAPTPGYILSTPNGVLDLRVGSLVARWDGLDVRLAFGPHIMGGRPQVHTLDLKKTIQPLVLGTPLSFLRTNPVIVIDPGHGGEDSGTSSVLGYRTEKDFTLDWARRLGVLLATNGWRVFMTRTNDVDLSLSNRIAFAEAHKAGVFLSLHFNSSAPSEQQAGLETYCLTPAGMPSTLTRGFSDDLGLAFPNNAFDIQNLQLALRAHRELLQVNGKRDRGVRRARFLGVLRGQHCPAILVEGGYLSNPQEAKRIADPAYRQKLAEALAQALIDKSAGSSQAPVAASQRAAIGARSLEVLSKNGLLP
ncbi:MAG: N-acetylmuramoyl-L-alanine amidase [Verrucomicrobia bacterium]|nr:N-acetylmuramoyl-L-alanine amidase [Verrucomicrobiota bacterium]